jgi:uncharacterized damage-inducible protein DinB
MPSGGGGLYAATAGRREAFAWSSAACPASEKSVAPTIFVATPRRQIMHGRYRRAKLFGMDARDLLRSQHTIVHSRAVGGLKSPTLADATFTVDDPAMRMRPAPGQNSLAWLMWHMARAEDVFVNLVFNGGAQLYDEAWRERLRTDRLEFGAGMTADEVAALSEGIDLTALRAYRDAVGRRTREVIAELTDQALEGRIEPADMQRAADAGALGHAVAAMTQFFTGQRRSVVFPTIITLHNAEHLGEAMTVRSLGGFGLGV